MCHVCGEEGGVWETKNVSACVTLCLFNIFVFLLVNAMIWTGITVEGVISGPLVVKNRIVNVKISFKQVSQTLLFAILPHCLPVYDHFFISFLAWNVWTVFFSSIFNFMLQLRYIVWECLIFSPSIDSLRDVIGLNIFTSNLWIVNYLTYLLFI